MSYVYHDSIGNILAISKENIITFDSITKVTFVPNLQLDVNYQFYMIDDNGTLRENVEAYRTYKHQEMSDAMDIAFGNRVFMSSFGFTVDNRRSGTKNDKDNVNSLITLGAPSAPFKSHDGSVHILSNAQLQQLQMEMIQDGFSVYQKKWALDAQIDQALNNTQLSLIEW